MKLRFITAGAIGAAMLVTACGGGDPASGNGAPTTPSASAGAASGKAAPDPGGRVIEVEMITDENGNYFRPADFEVRRGDVISFKLLQGVHNVSFPADSNPGAKGLPPVGPMLQLPGQTTDVKVDWAPGRYFYQCDPHALLGMVGHVTVVQ